MKTKYLFMLPLVAFLMAACDYSEDELQPSGETTSYTLPQGSHSYDQKIVDFYNNYGTQLIYKFEYKDAYWTPTGWQNGDSSEENGKVGFVIQYPDENYVGQQVDLLHEVWFDELSNKAKKELLPGVILLCGEVDYLSSTWDFSSWPAKQVYSPSNVYAYCNYANMCVGYANSSITSITDAEKKAYSKALKHAWAEFIADRFVGPTSDFAFVVDYSKVSSLYYIKECCAAGITTVGYSASALADWKNFLYMMMCYPEGWLTEDPGIIGDWDSFGNSYDPHEDTDFHGILNVAKDSNGLIKQRYDIVRQYFIDNYDIDIQTLGNNLE